jgi:hypothetical protein
MRQANRYTILYRNQRLDSTEVSVEYDPSPIAADDGHVGGWMISEFRLISLSKSFISLKSVEIWNNLKMPAPTIAYTKSAPTVLANT